jgi:ABC-type Fe3+-hydroxamate transport system, periplasmic component
MSLAPCAASVAGSAPRPPPPRPARRYTRRLDALRRTHADAPRLRVFYQIGTEPAYTVNRRSTVSQALAVCGGVNVFADLPRIADPVSAEAVMHAAPQAVFYGRDEPAAPMRAYWARLGSVPAVRHHARFRIDADLLARPGPRLVDGIKAVCADLDRLRERQDRQTPQANSG